MPTSIVLDVKPGRRSLTNELDLSHSILPRAACRCKPASGIGKGPLSGDDRPGTVYLWPPAMLSNQMAGSRGSKPTVLHSRTLKKTVGTTTLLVAAAPTPKTFVFRKRRHFYMVPCLWSSRIVNWDAGIAARIYYHFRGGHSLLLMELSRLD
jgi:hypothetical protein